MGKTLVSKLFGEGKQLKDLTKEELARYKNASYALTSAPKRKRQREQQKEKQRKLTFSEKTFGKHFIELTDTEREMYRSLYGKWYYKFNKNKTNAIPYEELNKTQKDLTKMAKTLKANNEFEFYKKVLKDLVKAHYGVNDEVADTLMLGLIYKAKGE